MKKTEQSETAAHTCNPSPWEAQAGSSVQLPCQSGLHNEFQVRPGLRKKKRRKKPKNKKKAKKEKRRSFENYPASVLQEFSGVGDLKVSKQH